MTRLAAAHRPKMRQQGLVIDQLPDEVLVYDLERHKAHCLNQTAGLVWMKCDGRTAPREIARRLEKELQAPCPEEVVWLALRQLESLHLLEEKITLPAPLMNMSRRQMVRTLGLAAAVALPLVTSIVAPTAVEAATCIQSGSPCSMTIQCCALAGCTPVTNLCV